METSDVTSGDAGGRPPMSDARGRRDVLTGRVPARNSEPLVAVADPGRRLIPAPASMLALSVALLAALRDQLAVLQRQAPNHLRLGHTDRPPRVRLSRLWPHLRRVRQIVTSDTVVRWHRRGFALHGQWRSRPRRAGRPAMGADIRGLIRRMHAANPLWGAPRIHAELLRSGSSSSTSSCRTIAVGSSTSTSPRIQPPGGARVRLDPPRVPLSRDRME